MRKLKGDSSKASEDIAPKCRQISRTFVFFLGVGGGGGRQGQKEVEKSVKEKTSEEWGENNFFALAFCPACPF